MWENATHLDLVIITEADFDVDVSDKRNWLPRCCYAAAVVVSALLCYTHLLDIVCFILNYCEWLSATNKYFV